VRAIDTFAKSGLRTLVYATRDISEQQWQAWSDKYLGTNGRGDEELESELRLVGVTAVEDCLSAGVPDTIELLQQANIKVWILTGDRLETALNVAVSCRLRRPDHQQLILGSPDALDTVARGVHRRQDRNCLYDLVIEGSTLDLILKNQTMTSKLLELAMNCSSVLCCRTSPLQKRLLTEKLQLASGKLCLAIGDGANDVGMIQAANVGIGIAGKEGRQAARSADISVRSFSQLSRLLLVHGAWSYTRLTKTIVYCAYKNLLLVTSQFWFGLLGCAASGQTIYESWMLSLSNALFTSYLPIVIGVTDQYVTADQLLRHPTLYSRGQRNSCFTAPRFWKAALNATLQALGLFLIHAGVMGGDPILADGTAGGMWVFSSTYYCSSLMTLLYKASIITR
jgi:phospholipid-transporting ATPase